MLTGQNLLFFLSHQFGFGGILYGWIPRNKMVHIYYYYYTYFTVYNSNSMRPSLSVHAFATSHLAPRVFDTYKPDE